MTEVSYFPETIPTINGFRCYRYDIKESDILFPTYSTDYRIANVDISANLPIMRIRLLGDMCIFSEFIFSYTLLDGGYVHCSLVGYSIFNEQKVYLGDTLISEDYLHDYNNDLITISAKQILNTKLLVVDYNSIISKYFSEPRDGNKLFNIIKDSFATHS